MQEEGGHERHAAEAGGLRRHEAVSRDDGRKVVLRNESHRHDDRRQRPRRPRAPPTRLGTFLDGKSQQARNPLPPGVWRAVGTASRLRRGTDAIDLQNRQALTRLRRNRLLPRKRAGQRGHPRLFAGVEPDELASRADVDEEPFPVRGHLGHSARAGRTRMARRKGPGPSSLPDRVHDLRRHALSKQGDRGGSTRAGRTSPKHPNRALDGLHRDFAFWTAKHA